jgi:hypothetical protein
MLPLTNIFSDRKEPLFAEILENLHKCVEEKNQ